MLRRGRSVILLARGQDVRVANCPGLGRRPAPIARRPGRRPPVAGPRRGAKKETLRRVAGRRPASVRRVSPRVAASRHRRWQNGRMPIPPVIDLAAAFDSIDRPWTPHRAADVNGHQVRLARLEGAFTWHQHADEDELFLVVRGRLRIEFRGGAQVLEPGQMLLVPRGVEHRPVAEPTADVLLFEPGSTVSTGATDDPRRVSDPPPLVQPSSDPPARPPVHPPDE